MARGLPGHLEFSAGVGRSQRTTNNFGGAFLFTCHACLPVGSMVGSGHHEVAGTWHWSLLLLFPRRNSDCVRNAVALRSGRQLSVSSSRRHSLESKDDADSHVAARTRHFPRWKPFHQLKRHRTTVAYLGETTRSCFDDRREMDLAQVPDRPCPVPDSHFP